jgi:hypothetical protein
MKYLVLLLSVFSAIFGWAQESQTRDVKGFSGIRAMENVDVYIKKGDKEIVRVEATGVSADNVLTEVSGGILKVHMKDGNYRRGVTVKVYVTYTSIDKLSANSAGSIFSEETMRQKSLDINVSSAGSVEVSVDIDHITANASSGGDIELKGNAKAVDFEASSGGQISGFDLQSVKATATASSGGSVKVSVKDDFDARASSGGVVRYRGNPMKSSTNASSGGSVRKSD